MRHFIQLGIVGFAWVVGCSHVYSSDILATNSAAPYESVADAKTDSIREISQVIEDFRSAIISKDKDKFVRLFYGTEIPWIGVSGDATYQAQHAKNPSATKAGGTNAFSYSKWIDGMINASNLSFEGKFWNITIDTDSDVATVTFDYSFHINGHKENWGKEAWQLVNTGKGWKINSVIYSVNWELEVVK
ncbi:nuclear transport factor 2 family protein [Sapientia aquatica]|uniref:Nuclear transport factor 2 family protein n=1 Tax=Sapientia aquatica TaxID=1549640 RepID=A0A4R5VUU5_9BURK|nr:nuclear transport factor 2 family protein [Sapientia aquatica]TDK62790.1 nuclear transport factor 2 family protein [Sapientia aquatica]